MIAGATETKHRKLMKLICTLILLLFSYAQQNDFIFSHDNQKIILKIDDGKRNLRWNEMSILNLKLENIDSQKMSFSAPGIKFRKTDKKNELDLEVTPAKEIFEKDSLNLFLSYKDQKEQFISHKFSIAIK